MENHVESDQTAVSGFLVNRQWNSHIFQGESFAKSK